MYAQAAQTMPRVRALMDANVGWVFNTVRFAPPALWQALW